MQNNEYACCDRLINGIDFELDCIELCCFRCHKGGGNIELIKIFDGKIDIDILKNNRCELINEFKNGKINSKCEGCFNLEEKSWDDKSCIKYIHFNHWVQCNTNCIYCYTQKDNKYKDNKQHYNALPILKDLINRFGFSPDGEITFAGGEPLLLEEFDEIIEYLLQIGAKKIIVHTSGVLYSELLAKAIEKGVAEVVISQDSGEEKTFKLIKNTDYYKNVWANTHLYAKINADNVFSKYVIIPKLNDNRKEIDKWLKKTKESGAKNIILDIEHNYYEDNRNDIRKSIKLLSLLEYIRSKAENLYINVQIYNAAKYLYSKYKSFVPAIRYKNYFLNLLILSAPIMVGSIGHTIIGATDVFVAARYDINALAAISIANAFLFTIFIFGIGLQDSISIILSNKRGKGEGIKKHLKTTLLFSLLLALLFSLICYSMIFIIDKFSFDKALVPYIKQYMEIVSFSMFGVFIYQGAKQFLQSYEIVNFPNMLILVSALINLILDFTLVFGFGNIIPSMGVKGAAIATLIVRSLMGLVMLLYVLKYINFKVKSDFALMGQFVRVGTPIGMALLIEFLAFNIITILVGKESGLLAATHNILITISSVTFNVPLAISVAVAVKVAYNYGAKKYDEIRKYAYMGIFMGVAFMALCSVILALFPRQLVGIFTKDTSVLNIAMPIVIIAAMYQVFDGFQVVMGGVLKGFKMTKAASLCVFWGYWIVGMPVAYILVNKYGMSLKGYWIALAVSLCFIGIFAAFIAKQKFKKIKNL